MCGGQRAIDPRGKVDGVHGATPQRCGDAVDVDQAIVGGQQGAQQLCVCGHAYVVAQRRLSLVSVQRGTGARPVGGAAGAAVVDGVGGAQQVGGGQLGQAGDPGQVLRAAVGVRDRVLVQSAAVYQKVAGAELSGVQAHLCQRGLEVGQLALEQAGLTHEAALSGAQRHEQERSAGAVCGAGLQSGHHAAVQQAELTEEFARLGGARQDHAIVA
mmetsp:Transcript_5416/g.16567  ORF Transcript_5416/g.16567 Transcript_5416/m.16567 type:complete len:214 (+) Transcript_5416:105-746(+)